MQLPHIHYDFSHLLLIGSLLDFLKEGDGRHLNLVMLVDMAAKVRPAPVSFFSPLVQNLPQCTAKYRALF